MSVRIWLINLITHLEYRGEYEDHEVFSYYLVVNVIGSQNLKKNPLLRNPRLNC